MPQKPPDLDEQGNVIKPPDLDDTGAPVTQQPVITPSIAKPQEESFLAKIWRQATTPIVPVGLPNEQMAPVREENPWISKGMDIITGALGGLTSPLNLATMGSFGIGGVAAKAGLPSIARTATGVGKGLSVPVAAEGAQRLYGAENVSEGIAGGLELLGGVAGMRTRIPKIGISATAPELLPDLPLNPQFNPKGMKGMTGELQQPKSPIEGTKVTLKKTSPEMILELRKQGFVPGGVTPEGRPFMVFKGKPIELEELAAPPEVKASIAKELYNLPRGLTTSFDISAPMRQGFPLITKKEWWTAWPDMIRSIGSDEVYQQIRANIEAKPLFAKKSGVDFRGGKWVKKEIPSYAEEAGLALTDLKSFSTREEALMSSWAERVPGVKASNRAYTTFLNKLRADTFESLIKDAERAGYDPLNNLQMGKEIADFVNTATGRGPLRTHIPTITGELKERSLEQASEILTNTLFSPKLVASRVRMLNPATYIAANPFVRKQYMKAFLSTVGTWGTIASLAKMAGADVSLDANNADFGKIKIGNTRLDPAAGFQQYLVLGHRLLSGKQTSSTSGEVHELGQGYKPPTWLSVTGDFGANKLHPTLKFAYDLWDASEYKPVQLGDRVLQMFVPLVIQDITELAKEDPSLLPLVIPIAMGMGTQTYEKGDANSVFIPPGMDINYQGGSPF